MALNTLFFCFASLCFVSLASPAFISDEVFISHVDGGRSLLENKKNCSIDFKNQDYTIITSKCIGPQYTNTSCCAAFKEFACPFVDYINDMTTNCAETMFKYINSYGYYPSGLFEQKCREGNEGLDCNTVVAKPPASLHPSSQQTVANYGGQIVPIHSIWQLMITSIVLLLIIGKS